MTFEDETDPLTTWTAKVLQGFYTIILAKVRLGMARFVKTDLDMIHSDLSRNLSLPVVMR